MPQWLIRLTVRVPGDMDPEVRADLHERTHELLDTWAGECWRIAGTRTWVAVVESADPHALITELPLHPWLDVTVEPLVPA